VVVKVVIPLTHLPVLVVLEDQVVVEVVMELLVDLHLLLEQVILLLQVLLKEILEVQEQ
jgi:hypothetical protein